MTDRELIAAATPGPWKAVCGKGSGTVQAKDCAVYINVRRIGEEYGDDTVKRWQADARLIARARTAWPEALDRIEQLEAENARLRAQLAEAEANRVRMAEYRFALEGVPTDGKGNPIKSEGGV